MMKNEFVFLDLLTVCEYHPAAGMAKTTARKMLFRNKFAPLRFRFFHAFRRTAGLVI